jgi:hypothetical protein
MGSNITKSLIERKEFSYAKKNTTLNFNLRVDNSSELKSFKDCLIEALQDIEVILKGMKN